ncbi:MAG: hypothetical protein CVU05_10890 [Bacteroidetes bacterium HGW-Bacteroidetes-21]|jgi:LysM repeat protein|nr:MAG: hypothetical protein CVU05_10890 [Bacteroidetes bacterium HGW-Bacteroidetes-21]
MKLRHILTLLCFSFSLQTAVYSQDIQSFTKSEITQTINNKKFYIHTIQAGQTIYSICKGYGIEQSDLALYNPEIFDGIKPGQQIKIPFAKTVNDETFTTHSVEKGETLYSIAKRYNCKIEEITLWNPETKEGLKKGQVLKIYKTEPEKINTNQTIETPPIDLKSQTKHHVVQDKETLYGISKQYNLNIQDIEKYNPWLSGNSIKKGDTLLLSFTEKPIINTPDTIKTVNEQLLFPKQLINECIPTPLNRPVKVIMLMPFSEDLSSIEKEEIKIEKHPELVPATKPFVEYYEGFLLALDSLKSAGISIELNVYNTNRDSATVANLISSGKLANADVVFGPVYMEDYKQVADFCKSAGIWSIYPLNTKKPDIENNPYIIQITPSYETQVLQAVRFMSQFNDKNYIVVQSGTPDELNFIKVFERELKDNFATNFPDQPLNYNVIEYKQSGMAGIEKVLQKEKDNVIILTSTSQAFILDMLNKLNGHVKNYKIIITYMPQWKKFENNIEFDHLFNLQATGFDYSFCNQKNTAVIEFNKKYNHYYKQFPGKFSYIGYDTGLFILSCLSKYGKDFVNCMNTHESKLLGSNYYFQKVNENGGWENQGIFIVKCHFDGKDIKEYKIVGTVSDKAYKLETE